MSTARSPLSRLTSDTAVVRTVGAAIADACAATVRGIAFWATIPFPLLIVGTLVSGFVASSPLSVVALVVLNVVCAAVGQNHTPTL